jgi:hypothetical protein
MSELASERDKVVEASVRAVLPSGGTYSLGWAEEQSLTLGAGAPLDSNVLGRREIVRESVGKGVGFVVLPTRRADSLPGESGKVHPLALRTRGPPVCT